MQEHVACNVNIPVIEAITLISSLFSAATLHYRKMFFFLPVQPLLLMTDEPLTLSHFFFRCSSATADIICVMIL